MNFIGMEKILTGILNKSNLKKTCTKDDLSVNYLSFLERDFFNSEVAHTNYLIDLRARLCTRSEYPPSGNFALGSTPSPRRSRG